MDVIRKKNSVSSPLTRYRRKRKKRKTTTLPCGKTSSLIGGYASVGWVHPFLHVNDTQHSTRPFTSKRRRRTASLLLPSTGNPWLWIGGMDVYLLQSAGIPPYPSVVANGSTFQRVNVPTEARARVLLLLITSRSVTHPRVPVVWPNDRPSPTRREYLRHSTSCCTARPPSATPRDTSYIATPRSVALYRFRPRPSVLACRCRDSKRWQNVVAHGSASCRVYSSN